MKTHGHFIYPIDDPYIHMAIGKHFISDGYWGVSQNGFSSSTSSPLWTLLIASAYKALGINDWVPYILSLLFGSFLIYHCYYLLHKKSNSIQLAGFLVLIVLLVPLPILTLTGLEHNLHSLLTIWLIYCVSTYLTKSENNSRQLVLLLLLTGLITITRYEGLFLVIAIMLLFLVKKQFHLAFLIGGAGLLPITAYGIFSITQGWYFLPNSILLKGYTPVFTIGGISSFLLHLPANLVAAPHVLMLIIACLSIYLWCEKQKVSSIRESYIIALFLLMTILHMQFASIGWFYRYEAYLVLVGSVIVVDMMNLLIADQHVKVGEIFHYGGVVMVLGIFFVIPLAWRTGEAFKVYPLSVMNIYEQQYQMGLFLKNYYTGKAVAANDIGAINYLAEIKTLDLYGLGSMESMIAKRNGSFTKNKVGELVSTHNVEIVIIFNSWLEGEIPPEWIEIGRWQITDNVIKGDAISFYAPSALWVKDVTANLRGFSNLLPSTVKQSGIYISP